MTAQTGTLQHHHTRKSSALEILRPLIDRFFPSSPIALLNRELRGKALIGLYLDDTDPNVPTLNLLVSLNGRKNWAYAVDLKTLNFSIRETQPNEIWLRLHTGRVKIARIHHSKDFLSIEGVNTPTFQYVKMSRTAQWHLYFSI